MVRESDGEVWDNPASYLWVSWLNRAINGKRGQVALRELERALVALPEKRLGDGTLFDAESGAACTLGVYYEFKTGKHLREQFDESEIADFEDIHESADFGVRELGLAWSLAWAIAEENDAVAETPEQRYERMLRWVRRQIKQPAVEVLADGGEV